MLPADWISAVEAAHRKNRALAARARDRVPDSRSSGLGEFQGEMPKRIHISEVVVRRHLASQVPRAAYSRAAVGVERGLSASVLAVSQPLGAIAHFDRSSREADHPLEARVRRVTGKPECDQVPALDALEATGDLAREDPVPGGQPDKRARIPDPGRLAQEDDHDCGDGWREQDVADPDARVLPRRPPRVRACPRIGFDDSHGASRAVRLRPDSMPAVSDAAPSVSVRTQTLLRARR